MVFVVRRVFRVEDDEVLEGWAAHGGVEETGDGRRLSRTASASSLRRFMRQRSRFSGSEVAASGLKCEDDWR